jgi:hypothetical protein
MEEKKTKEAPKKLLDHNASWPLTILYLGFLVGIYFAQNYSFKFITRDMNNYAYYFVAILGGVAFTFLFYNLGKILFARIAGYRINYIRLAGFFIDNSKGKAKVSFDITRFFTLALRFTPVDDDTKKNPLLIFLGGLFFEILLLAFALVFLFGVAMQNPLSLIANFGWTFLFAVCYGFLTPLYELVPFRQDYPTDMFNLLVTKEQDDKVAFNICQINERRELAGEDFLVPNFDNYDSFYKAHTLYFLYLEDLNASKLEKAFSVLEDMKYYSKYLLEDERYITAAETVYLKFLIDDEPGANKAFLSIKKDERKYVTDPIDLTGYRIAVLVLASIHSDKEAVNNLLKEFDALVASYGENPSARVKKEVETFNAAYRMVKKHKADLDLPER